MLPNSGFCQLEWKPAAPWESAGRGSASRASWLHGNQAGRGRGPRKQESEWAVGAVQRKAVGMPTSRQAGTAAAQQGAQRSTAHSRQHAVCAHLSCVQMARRRPGTSAGAATACAMPCSLIRPSSAAKRQQHQAEVSGRQRSHDRCRPTSEVRVVHMPASPHFQAQRSEHTAGIGKVLANMCDASSPLKSRAPHTPPHSSGPRLTAKPDLGLVLHPACWVAGRKVQVDRELDLSIQVHKGQRHTAICRAPQSAHSAEPTSMWEGAQATVKQATALTGRDHSIKPGTIASSLAEKEL